MHDLGGDVLGGAGWDVVHDGGPIVQHSVEVSHDASLGGLAVVGVDVKRRVHTLAQGHGWREDEPGQRRS